LRLLMYRVCSPIQCGGLTRETLVPSAEQTPADYVVSDFTS
jgi:hypothetical protein